METDVTVHAGLDFGLFDGRLSGSFDYMYVRRRDLLI